MDDDVDVVGDVFRSLLSELVDSSGVNGIMGIIELPNPPLCPPAFVMK